MQAGAAVHAALQVELAGAQATQQGLQVCHLHRAFHIRESLGGSPASPSTSASEGKMQAGAEVHAALQVELAGAQATKQGI
jgi:hypothetical protein